jgi:two-component system, cell cycle response regulator
VSAVKRGRRARAVALNPEGVAVDDDSVVIFESAVRAGKRALGSVSWGAMPLPVRVLVGVLFGLVALVAVLDMTPWLDVLKPAYQVFYNASLVASAVLCLARGALGRNERAEWTLIGASLALWATGNLYWQFEVSDLAEAPYPSVADGFWLAFLPVCYLGVLLLARKRLPQLDSRLWLDGLIAALTTGAISAAVVFGAVHAATGGDTAAVATNLAYPLGDMILLGTLIGVMAAGRGRMDRSWLFFGAGLAVFAITDSVYLVQVAEDTYEVATLVDVGWPLGMLLMALAAWQPAVRTRVTGDELPSIMTPIGLALASLVLLVYDHFEPTNLLALTLSTAALAAALVRLSLTHRASRANLVDSRVQARTDALTGLGNRFALHRALDAVLAESVPHVLLMLDLDGFKNYNDSYGHPAGDALLARLGSRLLADAAAVDGTAFRVGGDEFCVLASWPAGRSPEPLCESARTALCERGEGFEIGASVGYAALPGDAGDADEALRVADRRLYAEKNSGRVSARLQSAGVLRGAMNESMPELEWHTDEVATLAADVARRLELDEDEIERVVIAAELHDIGKIAIPRSILDKPGPLDDDEWEFMKRHTLIGERIAQSAPALVGVASLIRSSHERWDGTGYPDRLAGDEIPLGAQIVFVCDAYSAMTAERCYTAARSEAEARAELRQHAGTQFAPAVVDAFLAARPAAATSA